MVFTKRLREGVRRGEISGTVRFRTRPHALVGKRYCMGKGAIEFDSMETIGYPDITPELARESGSLEVLDFLKRRANSTTRGQISNAIEQRFCIRGGKGRGNVNDLSSYRVFFE